MDESLLSIVKWRENVSDDYIFETFENITTSFYVIRPIYKSDNMMSYQNIEDYCISARTKNILLHEASNKLYLN